MGQVDDQGRGQHSAPPEPPSAAAAGPARAGRHRAAEPLEQTGPDRRRRLRTPALAVIALVALVAVALGVVAVTRSTRGDDGGTAARPTPGQDLVAWAGAQLPPGATLSADPELTAELRDAGLGDDLLTTAASAGTGSGSGSGSGSDEPDLQVVRGTDPGGGTVVARFPDAAGGELTVVDRAAVPPDAAQLDQRRRLGAAIAANPMTAPPDAVAQRLRTGGVDPRLLTLLAGMAARFGVQLADLPTAPGEPTEAPARAAVVAAVGGRPVTEGSAELAELQSYLSAQLAVFSPDEVQVVEGGLLLRFRYITDPDGAVTRGGG